MRIIFSIALFVTCVLPCGRAFAGEAVFSVPGDLQYPSKEELRAEWESEENARIMGESALNSFRNGDESGIKLNALCSAESIEETGRLRDQLASVIKKVRNTGTATDESILAAKILSRAASFSVTALSAEEMELIDSINSLPVKNGPLEGKSLCGGGATPDGIAVFTPSGAVYSPGGVSFTPAAVKKETVGSFIHRINPGRKFETAHADYYRLFLYMRDDTGDPSCNKNTYCHPALYQQIFNTIPPIIQNSRLQKTTGSDNSDIYIIYSKIWIPSLAGMTARIMYMQSEKHVIHHILQIYQTTTTMEGFSHEA